MAEARRIVQKPRPDPSPCDFTLDLLELVSTWTLSRVHVDVAQSKAGSPNSCGSKASMLLSLSVASWVRPGARLSSGTITTCIPAASAAFTPLGASSNTKH
ncbi:hypothetical protein EYF80_049625 [Liparis tanakae]|uniref:Uncharacterized protein n=1 Tax=Liparis tanakae TaxID=230148 RepID=A0A4Z2FGB2_9TELE|nr:hypothetical protein EYF80_049625 [Liparis tanakae]